MKTSLLKMKKAVVKCTGMAMPELDLAMYKNPHRFVHALLESAEDLKTMKMYNAMSMMQQGQKQQAPQDMMFKKMMMKIMMKKMFKQEMGDEDDSPFGSMGAEKYGQQGSQYKFFEKMMQSMNRNKRATDDLFELGDRLTEKLKEET